MSDEDVQVGFGASIAGFLEGMSAVKEQLVGFKEQVASISEQVTSFGGLLATAFVGREIFEYIDGMAELGEQTERTASIFGIATTEVGFLNFAAAETGGSGEALTRSLERLSVSLQQAEGKATPTAVAIKALGLNAQELSRLPLPDLLDKLRDKFSALPEGLNRTAVAQALVRGGAESLLPILGMTNDKWEELRATFDATGAAMTASTAEGFAETKERITTFQTAVTGLGERLFAVMKPAIDAALDSMTKFIESMDASHAAMALAGISDVVIMVMTNVAKAAAIAIEAIGNLMIRLDYLNKYHLQAFDSENVAKMGADIDAMNARVDAGLQNTLSMFDGWSKKIHAYVDSVVGAPATVADRADQLRAKLSGTGPGLDFSGTGGASDALDAARAKSDGEIRVEQDGLARKQKLYDAELQMHQIDDAQYVKLSEAAIEEEYKAEKALLEKELKLGGLKLTQRQELLNKLKELEDKHSSDLQKIQLKSAQDAQKAWTSVGDAIASSVNSQISGLLKGTESIGQAMENIGLSLATTFLENALKSIISSAAQAFAGTFAFLAPTMGPAAAGPAAASQAAVLAVAGSAGLAAGTWGLPSDTVQQLHQGEMVIPAFQSDQFRSAIDALSAGGGSGAGGGGHTFHFHGPVMDKTGLAKLVADMFDKNPSLRPAYR